MKIETPEQAREFLGIAEKPEMTMGEHLIGIANSILTMCDVIKNLNERLGRVETDLYPEEDSQRLSAIWQSNGKALGYPQCCIDSFCNGQTWETATDEQKKATKHHFIPCHDHAVKIINGEITIESLIINRDPDLAPFGANI